MEVGGESYPSRNLSKNIMSLETGPLNSQGVHF